MIRPVALPLLAVLLAACAGEPTASVDEPSPSTSSQSTEAAERPRASRSAGGGDDAEAAPVPETLRFSATTVGGGGFEGASLAGEPVLLWFWAPWCPTCRSQIPQVEGLAEQYDGRVAVIGVGSLDSADAIAEFAGDVEGVTHLEDVEGDLYRKFGIAEQSSFVLLDADGTVAFETGYGGSEELGAEVGDVVG